VTSSPGAGTAIAVRFPLVDEEEGGE
jgi:hypothetical protein